MAQEVQQIVDATIKWAVVFVLGGVATYITTQLRARRKGEQALRAGMCALLRDRIIQAYNHYQDKGVYPIYARENIEGLYTQYHALGGNGTVKDLIARMGQLPTERNGGSDGGAQAG